MDAYPLPTCEAVEDLLSGLLGKKVEVTEGPVGGLGVLTHKAVAAYATEDGSIGALCLCELALASQAGAALSLLAPGVAEESVRRLLLEESILENFSEVMNVTASLLNIPGSPHLTLREVHQPKENLPEEIKSLISKPAARRDFDVKIQDYGGGKMAIIFTDSLKLTTVPDPDPENAEPGSVS